MLLQSLKQNFFQINDIVSKIIWVNAIIFFISWFGGSIMEWFHLNHFSDWLYKHTAVSSNFSILIQNPWSLISYQFMHANLLHIFFNMYILYIFGRFIKDVLNSDRFIVLYLLSGLAGAAVFIFSYLLLPLLAERGGGHMVGASAAVMGVVIGASRLYPELELYLLLFGRVKLKWLALAVLILGSYDITGSNAGGSLSHFGGAAAGFFLVNRFKNGKNDLNIIARLFTGIRDWFYKSKAPKLKVRHRSKVKMGNDSYNYDKADRQEKVDAILDKISKSGFDSLTQKERDFLSNINDN